MENKNFQINSLMNEQVVWTFFVEVLCPNSSLIAAGAVFLTVSILALSALRADSARVSDQRIEYHSLRRKTS